MIKPLPQDDSESARLRLRASGMLLVGLGAPIFAAFFYVLVFIFSRPRTGGPSIWETMEHTPQSHGVIFGGLLIGLALVVIGGLTLRRTHSSSPITQPNTAVIKAENRPRFWILACALMAEIGFFGLTIVGLKADLSPFIIYPVAILMLLAGSLIRHFELKRAKEPALKSPSPKADLHYDA